VDPSGYQPGLNDPPANVWPNVSSTPGQGSAPPVHLMHPTGPVGPPPPPPHPGRIPMIPFPPQHVRPIRAPAVPEYRLHDLNKRLSMRTEECDNLWWENFVSEFFEDDATLTLSLYLEDGLKRFSIGRVLIPRFFRTLFDGGVTEVYFLVKQTKEMFHNPLITLDCEQASMVTCFGKPSHIKVCSEGNLILDFTCDESMRIKTWHFAIKQYREMIPRSVVAIPVENPNYFDQLTKNITRSGLTSVMLTFLRLCEILEPMQELMSRHKTTSFSPRDCLKTTLHQRWSKNFSIENRPTTKPRRKKRSATTTPNNLPMNKEPTLTNCSTPTKKRSTGNAIFTPTPPNNLPGDVMIVGEPSLMGGEMDDEDERFITRIENAQYDPNSSSISSHSSSSSSSSSFIHQKQFGTNSNLIKREQISSFPNSPGQQTQLLPSMFSTTTPINGEIHSNSIAKRISSPSNPSTPAGGAPQSTTPTPTTNNSTIGEKKQEPQTPPATPQQQTIATAS